MAVISRQLATQITTASAWIQLTEGVGGTAYACPTSGSYPRADVGLLRAINQSAGSATLYLAFHTTGSPTTAHEVWNNPVISPNAFFNDDSLHVLRSGEKIWAKVTVSTGTPIVTVRGSLLELT